MFGFRLVRASAFGELVQSHEDWRADAYGLRDQVATLKGELAHAAELVWHLRASVAEAEQEMAGICAHARDDDVKIARLAAELADSERIRGTLCEAGFEAADAIRREYERAEQLAREVQRRNEWRAEAIAERDLTRLELLEALRERDRLRAALASHAARIDELTGDAQADAERAARLEDERERALSRAGSYAAEADALEARDRRTRRRLISSIKATEAARGDLAGSDAAYAAIMQRIDD